jgi:hypothetical protein
VRGLEERDEDEPENRFTAATDPFYCECTLLMFSVTRSLMLRFPTVPPSASDSKDRKDALPRLAQHVDEQMEPLPNMEAPLSVGTDPTSIDLPNRCYFAAAIALLKNSNTNADIAFIAEVSRNRGIGPMRSGPQRAKRGPVRGWKKELKEAVDDSPVPPAACRKFDELDERG